AGNPLGLAEADGLLKRVPPEAAAAGDVAVEALRRLARHGGLDAGPDGRPVGLLAHQLDGEPVVVVAGVLEEDVAEAVAGGGAAELDEQVHVAVAVPIAAGHRVPLLEVPGTARRGDIN